MNLSPQDQFRVARGIKKTERLNPPRLGGNFVPKRGNGPNVITVQITSNIGTAKYQGLIQTGAATDLDGTGITASTNIVLILNLAEKGSTASEPYLPNGSWVIAITKGIDTATGIPIVWTSEILGYVCEYDTSSGSTGSGGA
jgi:hypothetical protein